jgi:hypothetical protein
MGLGGVRQVTGTKKKDRERADEWERNTGREYREEEETGIIERNHSPCQAMLKVMATWRTSG